MPFSSLFNRKGSRKNQSKVKSTQVSKQKDPSEDGTSREVPKTEDTSGKTELLHVDSAPHEQLNAEGKTCEITEVSQIQSEVLVVSNHSNDQKLLCDNCTEKAMEDEKDAKEDEILVEENYGKILSVAHVKLHDVMDSQHRVDETNSCESTNKQELQNNTLTHSTTSQNGTTSEENQVKAGNSLVPCESVPEKSEPREVKDEGITGHADSTENITDSLLDENVQHSAPCSDAVRDSSDFVSGKNEGSECGRKGARNTSSHILIEELPDNETSIFSETNNSEEPQTNEPVINVPEFSESNKELPSVVDDIQESKCESIITNYGDHTDSILLTKAESKNEQPEQDVTECEGDGTGVKIKSEDIRSTELSAENKSTNDFSSNQDEHVKSNSQSISDKNLCGVTVSEEMEIQGSACSPERNGAFEEIASAEEKAVCSGKEKECKFKNGALGEIAGADDRAVCSGKEKECKFENGPFEEIASADEKAVCSGKEKEREIENGTFKEIASADKKAVCKGKEMECKFENVSNSSELQTQASSSDISETLKERNHSNDESYAEHENEKEQASETIATPPQSVTSTCPVISPDGSCDVKSEAQTVAGDNFEKRRNSTDGEQTVINAGDTNSSAEILENTSSLITEERHDIIHSLDTSPEVSAIQSTSPLEESLDSFPSGCEDFLGGQRTLMAAECHTPPSWKVGYLQVKLPAKSRGRGKLKVWRQRWVVIQMDEFVKETKNPSLMINIYASECSNARRHSALFWCTVSASKTVVYRSQSRTHKYAFSISVDNDVILHLAADSETASQEWMTAIRNLLWPPNPVLQLEKVLHGSDFEVSIIDNEFSFHAGLLGTYGNMKVTSNKLILSHPQTDHVIQEWYLNTLDRFQLVPQSKEEDAFKIVVMHTGQDSSTGSGQIILFCPEAVTMLQSIASTIHKLLQYRTTSGKDHYQKELACLAEWVATPMPPSSNEDPPEDYYKIPRHPIRSILDIPNFSFEKALSTEGFLQSQEPVATKPSMLPSATSASTFSEDSGISMGIQSDDFLNCSVTSFTIGGRPVRDHTSSESSDGYSPPCSPETQRKNEDNEVA